MLIIGMLYICIYNSIYKKIFFKKGIDFYFYLCYSIYIAKNKKGKLVKNMINKIKGYPQFVSNNGFFDGFNYHRRLKNLNLKIV